MIFFKAESKYPQVSLYANMIVIPGGTFDMGWTGMVNPLTTPDTSSDPVHTVTLTSYMLSRYECSYLRWETIRVWAVSNGYVFTRNGASGGGTGSGNDHPVTDIQWNDVIAWCNAASEYENLTPCYYTDSSKTALYKNAVINNIITNDCVNWQADGYRLPTEAEWEYAARFIDGSTWYNGNSFSGTALPADIWYNKTGTAPVQSGKANALGLYHMNGNAAEWCWDVYGDYTTASPYTDINTPGPLNGPDSTRRSGRSGTWADVNIAGSYNAARSFGYYNWHEPGISFRLAKNLF